MATDLVGYLRRYRPSISREEVAIAAGISIATLTRRMREGFEASEVIRAAHALGASPVEALVELGYVSLDDVRRVAGTSALDLLADRELLEELLIRAHADEATVLHDREEAGLPAPSPSRFQLIHSPTTVPTRHLRAVSDTPTTFRAASDADIDAEVEAQQEEP